MNVITRFPPSPTGYLHVGGARTALFNWLYARKNQGQMVLRVEDTDLQRSTDDAVQAIFSGLEWLGLDWDLGPFYQTKRFERYQAVIDQLLSQKQAYYCVCSREKLDAVRSSQMEQGIKPRYDHCCRDLALQPKSGTAAVVRFATPLDGVVVFDDVVRGKVAVANQELDDFIIRRSDGTPTYNFAVVVDDVDMHISHVIRGDDHTNNTPRQINLFNALKADTPVFAHVPMILGADGQKLSKRHGAISVTEYQSMGILPEAMLNYLVRLGWSHGDQEIFSIDEMIELFDIKDINKSAAGFDESKLLWINQHYLKQAKNSLLVQELQARLAKRGISTDNGPLPSEVVEALRERAQTLEEMADKAIYFYHDFAEINPAAAKKHLRPVVAPLLTAAKTALAGITDWTVVNINAVIDQLIVANQVSMAKVAQPLRVAISGDAATPAIDLTVYLVGKEKTLIRIDKALAVIAQRVKNA